MMVTMIAARASRVNVSLVHWRAQSITGSRRESVMLGLRAFSLGVEVPGRLRLMRCRLMRQPLWSCEPLAALHHQVPVDVGEKLLLEDPRGSPRDPWIEWKGRQQLATVAKLGQHHLATLNDQRAGT